MDRKALVYARTSSMLVLLVGALATAAPTQAQAGHARIHPFSSAAHFGGMQLEHAITYLGPTQHARSTLPNGMWNSVGAANWTSGFFAGCQWWMYERTGSLAWRARARAQTLDLASQQFNTGDHDVGFRIMSSYGRAYRATGDASDKAVILNAAQSLATRFDATVGCTRSWDFGPWQFPVIIDNMMNLELLFFAARNGGSPTFDSMARSHALRTMQEHVRPDGSTFHVVDFDPISGAVLWRGTYQGHADDSTWARGQAWGIYGFTMAYRYTHEAPFLQTAMRLADFYLANLPADGVPYWDFDAPNIPNEPRDSSAAAVSAAGLLELAAYAPTPADRLRYRNAGESILFTLVSPAYLAAGTTSDGILLHAVGNRPANSEVDVSLIYGDYYFLEALDRWATY